MKLNLKENGKKSDEDIKFFIDDIRQKYMGDLIDVNLSKGKPIQVLPYFNYIDRKELYKNIYLFSYDDILDNLLEINVFLDDSVDILMLFPFLESLPKSVKYIIKGNLGSKKNMYDFLSFMNHIPSKKELFLSYDELCTFPIDFKENFTYMVFVDFPLDKTNWDNAWKSLLARDVLYEIVFNIKTEDDIEQVEDLIEEYNISNYQLNPVYTSENIQFFEKYVYLSREDVLSNPISIRDIFIHQTMNTNDYGKLSLMPNGDVYANLKHPKIGNIKVDNIDDIVLREMKRGQSWFRIRNQEPCNKCVLQWLCPSPSDYELAIGRPNLCGVMD